MTAIKVTYDAPPEHGTSVTTNAERGKERWRPINKSLENKLEKEEIHEAHARFAQDAKTQRFEE